MEGDDDPTLTERETDGIKKQKSTPTPKSGLQEPGNLAREGLEERRLETDAHLGLNSDRPRLDSIKNHTQARNSELSTSRASSSSQGVVLQLQNFCNLL